MPFDIITYALLKKTKPTISASATVLPAAEDLSAGDFVNIFDDGGTIKVRKADAGVNKPAYGYVLDDVTAGNDVTVYFDGLNTKLSGLNVGSYYFLSNTPGKITSEPGGGYFFLQEVGIAISTNALYVNIKKPESSDIGIFGGGYNGNYQNIIDFVLISTPGNATDFGDLTVARYALAATSNGTDDRGIFGGGHNGSAQVNTIDYVTISSLSNANDFGDLTEAKNLLAATSNGTDNRGIFGGGIISGVPGINTIDYVTISTPGNATDFGDLTVARYDLAATSNGTDDRGIFGGGYDGSDQINVIDYVTISTPGNATDFGDLSVTRDSLAATSNA